MKKSLLLLVCCIGTFYAKAQQPVTKTYQPYGKVDKDDLEMKECDFEKDANAEVLFDKEYLNIGQIERHTRIKIFNEQGKGFSSVKIEYYGGTNLEQVRDIDAETINLINGRIEITKIDKSQIYKQVIDKFRSEMIFTLPNVKSGSIIEFKYTINSLLNYELAYIPTWFFQNIIPVRYSELNSITDGPIRATAQIRTRQPFFSHKNIWLSDVINNKYGGKNQYDQMIMVNVPAFVKEPNMTSLKDNLESITYHTTGFGYANISNTWEKVGKLLNDDPNFGGQLNRKLTDEDSIVNKAKLLNTDAEKVTYIFDKVRDAMTWNGLDNWYTNDGTYRAWQTKTGNSSEINIILYHLLKKAGIKACPMLVSTRENGKMNPAYTSLAQFNRTVIFVPLNADSSSYNIVDATGKYNTDSEIPEELLNSSGLCVDQQNAKFNIVSIENNSPIRKVVFINAEIFPDGKINGAVDMSDYGYNRVKSLKLYKKEGEQKFIDYLKNGDNSISLSSLSMENAAVDSLPLTVNFNFRQEILAEENYIYVNPNLFTSLKNNPFVSEHRLTDIDFGFRDNYLITEEYKMPAGYKIEALPPNITFITPDTSIVFKRIITEDDGKVILRYNIDHKRSLYFKEDYDAFHEFYKKMYETLNEQIVLKKS